MEITLVIDDSSVVIDASFVQLQSEMIDVTAFGDAWRSYIPSGIRTLTVEGRTIDGAEFEATFVLEDVIDHQTYVVGTEVR